jgi:hypothetical protein
MLLKIRQVIHFAILQKNAHTHTKGPFTNALTAKPKQHLETFISVLQSIKKRLSASFWIVVRLPICAATALAPFHLLVGPA